MPIKVYSNVRKRQGKPCTLWWVAHKKEVLSGPWKTAQEAWEAKQEWIV